MGLSILSKTWVSGKQTQGFAQNGAMTLYHNQKQQKLIQRER